jgi:glycosyltransferase involved in cell wall biosynthesis
LNSINALPLLSVIVRTLGNDINLLKKAVTSVFENSYSNIEIIIVFQGIDFETFEKVNYEISSHLPSMNINYIQNKTTKDERSKNLNLGLAASKGKYLAFLDDDDYVAPNHYENLISAIKRDNAAMAFCIARVVNENGEVKHGLFEGRYLDKLSFYKDNFITIHSFVVAKEVIDRLNIKFDERLQLAEDYLFLLPIYMKEVVSFVQERSCFYRIVSKESQSFSNYEESGLRDKQYALLKKLRRPYKPNFLQKMKMKLKRKLKLVYSVTE